MKLRMRCTASSDSGRRITIGTGCRFDLSRAYGYSIELVDYLSDRNVTDSTLRFTARLQ